LSDPKKPKLDGLPGAFRDQPCSSPLVSAQLGGRSDGGQHPGTSGGREHSDSCPPQTLNSDTTLNNPDPIDMGISKFDQENLNKLYSSPQCPGILWHLRLNHASKQYLEAAKKFLPELKGVKFSDDIAICEDCHQANTIRKSHSQTRHRAEKRFAVMFSDLMGPISPANFRSGDSYIVIFVCSFSRYVFAYTLKNKKEVHLALKRCLLEVASITAEVRNVFTIRSDRGLEFQTSEMKKLLSEEGIIWEPSQPYVPQQNGSAERVNQELKHKIRVNLHSARMPFSFWGHALNYTVFVYNRMPHSANLFVSPFEKVRGYAPSLKFMKRFGCLVHYVDPSSKTKFAPNAKKGYLLECSDTGYVIFSEQHKTLVNSCDVKCIETIVYGDRIQDYPRPLAEILDMGDTLDQIDTSEKSENVVALQKGQSEVPEPSSYKEAMNSSEKDFWEGAIREELDSLIDMNTWELVPKSSLPSHTKIVKSRWVHKRKQEPDGSIRYKSRLVIKGFADTNEYLISEVFAPVARLGDVRLFLSAVNKFGLHLFQLDVTTAFLHGTLEKPVYMGIPEGLVELTELGQDLNDSYVCCLKRSLYGLKVSPNLWYKKFSSVLRGLGFEAYPFQSCMFKWHQDSTFVLMLIYVDDCLLATNDSRKALEVIQNLQKEIKIKNLGEPKKFLGFEIIRNVTKKVIFLHQKSAIEALIEKYLYPKNKISETPMAPITCTLGAQMRSTENDVSRPELPYREVIGSLLYIQNCTRPDISFSVNFMSRKQVGYTLDDWNSVMRILQYLKRTSDYGILISGKSDDLIAYSDASLGTSAANGRSTTGYLIKCFGDLVAWRSKKQSHVALSTCEAEYIAMSDTCKELTNIRSLCEYVTGIGLLPTLRCDCAPAISVAMTNDSRTLKHIVKLCMHYVHENFKNNKLEITWVPSEEQLADIFTKALPLEKFVCFRDKLVFRF